MSSDANINVLNMKDKSYQILPTADDIKVNRNEYINILALTDVTEVDNGTYICFVAKNGLNSLTFKSASVHVVQGTYCLLVTTLICIIISISLYIVLTYRVQISVPKMQKFIRYCIFSRFREYCS